MQPTHESALAAPAPRAARRWRDLLPALTLALFLLTPADAHSRSVLVDHSNPHAYQRINDALDSMRVYPEWGVKRLPIDTVFVAAGAYPETLMLWNDVGGVVRGLAAPESVVVASARAGPCGIHGPSYRVLQVQRFQFTSAVVDSVPYLAGGWLHRPEFRECIFSRGVKFNNFSCEGGNLLDCVVRGNSELTRFNGWDGFQSPFRRVRFERCTLTIGATCGDIWMEDCHFVGPVDTAVYVSTPSEDPVVFEHCTFDSCGIAVTVRQNHQACAVISCSFTDCGVGVAPKAGAIPSYAFWGPSIEITGSRFTRVDTAVRTEAPWRLSISADTVTSCRGAAISASVSSSTVRGFVVDGAGSVSVLRPVPSEAGYPGATLVVENCEFRNSLAAGLEIAPDSLYPAAAIVTVRGSRFVSNGGTGLAIATPNVTATHNTAFANTGAGFAFAPTSAAGTDSIAFNTGVFNDGDGLTISVGPNGTPTGLVVARNVSAMNAGAGFSVGAGFSGTFANNDAWQNYGAGYSGFAADASNLVLDPQFCGLPTGDLSVSVGSPCDPAMSTGPMGALGVGCGQELLGVPPSTGLVAFSVRPSPARGSVEFAVPPGAASGRVEVIDAQGRRIWSAALAAGAGSVRWRGETEHAGSASAGLYWVHLTRPGETQVRHFVWLR